MEKKDFYTTFKALKKAKEELQSYFKENNLSPLKTYYKHPVHGKVITKLVNRLNIERAKILDNYHILDKEHNIVLLKLHKSKYSMALKKKKKTNQPEEAKGKKSTPVEEPKKAKKETKKEKAPKAHSKYDYPLIEGREMTKDEKKKYRAQQRKEATGTSKPKKEKAPKEAKEVKPAKVSKKKETPEKPVAKVKKAKSKKAPKDED